MAERLKGEDAYDSAIKIGVEGRADTEDGAKEVIELLEKALHDGIPSEEQANAYKMLADKYIIAEHNYQTAYNLYKKALTIRKSLNPLNESEMETKLIWQHAYHMMYLVSTKIKPDDVGERIKLYEELIELTNHPKAHLFIAYEFYDINDKDKARQHFEYIVNNEDKLKTFEEYYEVRKNASDALKTPELSKKSGCFIATAIYGDMFAPEVVSLREYRDSVLNRSKVGRIFIQIYYYISPPLAQVVSKHALLERVIRKVILDHLVHLIRSIRRI